MTVVIPAEPSQVEAIAALAEEINRFYGATKVDPQDVRLRQITKAIFGEQPAAYALLAWNGKRLVGLASYSFLWPAAGLTRSLFLKELYVVESERRSGVGGQLMRAIFATAVKQDCSRVEWQTETANGIARAFYSDLGGQELDGRVFYRLEGERLIKSAK